MKHLTALIILSVTTASSFAMNREKDSKGYQQLYTQPVRFKQEAPLASIKKNPPVNYHQAPPTQLPANDKTGLLLYKKVTPYL